MTADERSERRSHGPGEPFSTTTRRRRRYI